MTNTTNYPLTGGVKPTSPAFPAEMNPEVQRLQAENQKLQEELRIMHVTLELKQQQLDAYFHFIEILAGKNGGITNTHA